MVKIKFEDVLEKTIKAASPQFEPSFKVSDEKYTKMKSYGTFFDELVEDVYAETMEISIDGISGNISITIECEDLVIDEKFHQYYTIIQNAIHFGFTQNKVPRLLLEFEFPSVWEPKK